MRKIFLLFVTLVAFAMASDTASLKEPLKVLLPFEEKLWGSLRCNKDYTLTRQLLDSNPDYFTDLDYPSYCHTLGENYVEKSLDLETLTLLVENGLDLNTFTRMHVSSKAQKLIQEYGYKTFSYGLDYGRLKEEVKALLAEHNITKANYYEERRSYSDHFLERLARYCTQPQEEIKWFLAHGYKASDGEINKAFLSAIQHKNVDVVGIWKGLEPLGASFKIDYHSDEDNAYLEQEYEIFMNSVLNAMIDYRNDDVKVLKFLIAEGVDINAKSTFERSIAHNLRLSDDLITAKIELQEWMSLGLKIPRNSLWVMPMSSLTQITKMNLPVSKEAGSVLDERISSSHTSYLKRWLMVVVYAPILAVIAIFVFLLFLFALWKVFKKSRK